MTSNNPEQMLCQIKPHPQFGSCMARTAQLLLVGALLILLLPSWWSQEWSTKAYPWNLTTLTRFRVLSRASTARFGTVKESCYLAMQQCGLYSAATFARLLNTVDSIFDYKEVGWCGSLWPGIAMIPVCCKSPRWNFTLLTSQQNTSNFS